MSKAAHRAVPTIGLPWAVPTAADGAILVPRDEARAVIEAGHYSHSFPSGWVRCYRFRAAYVVFSISANRFLEPMLYGADIGMRELARMWAPDLHDRNLLTQAVAAASKALRRDSGCQGLVSFADPNEGHLGTVYQACSWIYTGTSSETRVYRLPDGTPVARRSHHSGSDSSHAVYPPMERALPKHRYVHPLTRTARRCLAVQIASGRVKILPYPKGEIA